MSLPERPTIIRFFKYVLVGGSTTAFDLALVWLMTEYLAFPYYVSTTLGFLAGSTPNYFIARRFVFTGTERRIKRGYLYYITAALLGALAITGSVALLVTMLGAHYFVARIGVAGIVGLANYLFNLHLNFKVAGYHP